MILIYKLITQYRKNAERYGAKIDVDPIVLVTCNGVAL